MFVFFPQPSQQLVIAPGVKVTGNKWTINSETGVVNAIQKLHTEQPLELEIKISRETPTPTSLKKLCKVIQHRFTGSLILILYHSYLTYDDCSDIIKALGKSR